MFLKFLNSLKRPNNQSLIESIDKGYKAIFENNTKLELINMGANVQANHVILYRGADVPVDKIKQLKYGDFLSTVKSGHDAYGNLAADSYGKNIATFKLPIKDIVITNGEIQYKGKSESTKGTKYPEQIYKAYNDAQGSNYTAKEIDNMRKNHVKMAASAALNGGKKEFEQLLMESYSKNNQINTTFGKEPRGQTFDQITADINGTYVGRLVYELDFPTQGQINIELIETEEKYRRQGIAKFMIKKLKEKYPDYKISGRSTNQPAENLLGKQNVIDRTVQERKNLTEATEEANETIPIASDIVDGLKVRPDVPNTSSIASSFNNYKVLPHIRELSLKEWEADPHSTFSSKSDIEQVKTLAEKIKESNEINPLIIELDKKGELYVVEGVHRLSALHVLGKKSFPALVVLNLD